MIVDYSGRSDRLRKMKDNFLVVPNRVLNMKEMLLEADGYEFVVISSKLPENEFVSEIYKVFYPGKPLSIKEHVDTFIHSYDDDDSRVDILLYLGEYLVVDISLLR